MQRFALLLLAVLILASCSGVRQGNSAIRVISLRQLPRLPSASGITRSGDRFLVNADNAPFLYVLNASGQLVDSLVLLHENPRLHEISKPAKPDYEAAAIVDWKNAEWLLLVGSGTVSPTRDSLLMIPLAGQGAARKADLRRFYAALVHSGIAESSINIEAAAAMKTSLLLFNRGTNAVITVDRDSFLAAALDHAPIPRFSVRDIRLPLLKGFPVGISGAAVLDDSTVLFCGSVEATTDWAKDGEILGSGVGMLRLRDREDAVLLSWTMLADSANAPIPEKLEGIELIRRSQGSVLVRCVADSDNGSSTLLDLAIPLPAGAAP